jgi:AcrR family transcriptional regulator
MARKPAKKTRKPTPKSRGKPSAKSRGKPGAKSRAKSRAKPRAKSRGGSDVPGRIIEAALTLAVSRGWKRIGLADIAKEAGVTTAVLRRAFPSKEAILNGFVRQTDEQVLAQGKADGSSARDRLFDVLMRRFDVLQTHRDSISAIARDSLLDPAACLCHGPRFMCSMAWMLETAGLSSAGPAGMLRTKGLALVYLVAFRAWLRDDSADKAATMAALDRGLRQAEAIARFLFSGLPLKPDKAKKD